jgi:predicted TIM-barrel fold metal-dependent hydrolase
VKLERRDFLIACGAATAGAAAHAKPVPYFAGEVMMAGKAAERAEEIIDPDLPIVDAHHHLWYQSAERLDQMKNARGELAEALYPVYRRNARYLFEEYLADARAGHNVVGSVFVDSHLLYRADGPAQLRSVGEVEVVNGVAAMSASGLFGARRLCCGIVGRADLTLGDAVEEVLVALMAAGGDRFKGVRWHVAHDDDPSISPPGFGHAHLLANKAFRQGIERLGRHGLSFEAYVVEPQLPELTALARNCPGTRIVLNHVGTPLGIGRYRGRLEERFPIWKASIMELAGQPNVVAKLGGLGMPQCGFSYGPPGAAITSQALADRWRPYIETCIEAFGVERCMFESNYPLESITASYPMLWNAFKRIASGASSSEKAALFHGTAVQAYRLEGQLPADILGPSMSVAAGQTAPG